MKYEAAETGHREINTKKVLGDGISEEQQKE